VIGIGIFHVIDERSRSRMRAMMTSGSWWRIYRVVGRTVLEGSARELCASPRIPFQFPACNLEHMVRRQEATIPHQIESMPAPAGAQDLFRGRVAEVFGQCIVL